MRLAKRAFCLLALAAFFVAVPKGFAEPRDQWSLQARVPSSAMAMLSIEDVAGMGAKFEKTAIAGLFRDPEMQAFVQPIGEQIQKMLESEKGSPFGEATPIVMKLLEQLSHLRGQLAIALLDVDPGQGMPRAVLSLDFGQHVGDFAQFLDGMRNEIDPDGKGIRAYEKDGRTWWQVQDGPPITATTVDTAFVAATDATLLEGVIAGAGETALAGSADSRAVRARSSSTPTCRRSSRRSPPRCPPTRTASPTRSDSTPSARPPTAWRSPATASWTASSSTRRTRRTASCRS